MPVPLSFPNNPAIGAATSLGASETFVEAIPVADHDVNRQMCLPASSPNKAASMMGELLDAWSEAADEQSYKSILGISKSVAAEENYYQIADAALKRFSRVVEEVGAEVRRTNKYSPENAKKILNARNQLTFVLKELVPGTSSFVFSPPIDLSKSNLYTEKLDRQLLTNNTNRKVLKSLVNRGASKNLPSPIPKNLSKQLSYASKFVLAIEIAPPLATVLTTDDQAKQEKAFRQLIGIGVGMGVESAATKGGLALCALFTLTTAGWGFLACGIGAIGTGIFLGKVTEGVITKEIVVPGVILP